ncbi:sugar phosphate isomerase/epimerase [Radiobacillus kanasensis]|uniref:sugar phosphate isomerase/epimerase family protein n=1 Tax=Radiobacillus kanasensis TaxID=2844358 RepID=UPI001E3DDF54|nr:sugar phosphate isomerase/epimerase [Radiobacillus kanasensis]UFT98750.1 sugar phosphate isomerase/epimerase [Radiobacillus kanasensis]
MSIGVLAHLFGKSSYEHIASQVSRYGFSYVQLALWKAFEYPDFTKVGYLNTGLVREIKGAFDKHGVVVSTLACYLHLFLREENRRRNHLERFKELIRHAHSFGTNIIAVEVGKMPDGFVQEDWYTLKQSLLELIDEAEKHGVIIGIEPAHEHLIGDAKTLSNMLEEIPSSSLGVVLDPGNLLHDGNFLQQDEVIKEAFRLLGDRIVACHAKDRVLDNEGRIKTVPPGQGKLNYKLYMHLVEEYKPNADIIMEAAQPKEMLDSKAYVEGIRFQMQMEKRKSSEEHSSRTLDKQL